MNAINNFSQLSAENEISRLAQLAPEEMAEANAYYDSLAQADQQEPEVTPEGLTLNITNWRTLDVIHEEITPRMNLLRLRDAILDAI
jgi:hypothetical protein